MNDILYLVSKNGQPRSAKGANYDNVYDEETKF